MADLGIIPDGAVLIRDGRIEEVGPGRRVENLAAARGAVEIAATGRVVMPGFVDSHTHLIYPPRAERAADPEAAARIWRTTTARLLAARAQPFVDAMARHGTTTVEVKSGCGAEESAEFKAMRVIALLAAGPIDIVPTHLLRIPDAVPPADAEQIVRSLTPRVLRRGRPAFADIWWNANPDRQAVYARFAAEAASGGAGLKVHATGPGCAGAVALAVGHRAASLDHVEHMTTDLAPLLAEGRTVVTLMPSAALGDWRPSAPARGLIDAGVAIALASGFNPHQSPTASMQAVVALACLRMEMTAAEAIAAATINGAHAVRRAATVGSIEPGKSADILLLNTDDYRELGRCLGINMAHLVLKSGAVIYREGGVRRTH